MIVFGETVLARFTQKHAASRKPLARFLKIVHNAEWPHFSALKETFSTADTGKRTGKVIFDIGGNKYRLIAVVNFERQSVLIDQVFTHEEYDREVL